ncbi:MAG TPA: septal ring lytic transglycosylase RlpA family protein [Solirubrobacterales bacterium]|jgi:rare lipoprotein A (peptidoglycan hydrolase)|nr:septal ring lytic transglycosylase RlpA family protein [Solirubrobacterales bacterium]
MTTIKQTSLRWAMVLAAMMALMAGAATGAKAATGGASGTASAPGGEIAFSAFRYAGASWYGPGLWGNKTACGAALRRATLGVAHKTLPCGTTVKFVYHGHALITRVIDRGPYVKGRAFDLTQAASEALGFEGVGRVRYAVALSYARLR